jgi:hypothetical protein
VPLLRRLAATFPPRRPGFEPRIGHLGFVVDTVTLRPVSSEYFGCPYQCVVLLVLLSSWFSRATTHAVGRHLPTATTRVGARDRSFGICGGRSDTAASFLRVLRFPSPMCCVARFAIIVVFLAFFIMLPCGGVLAVDGVLCVLVSLCALLFLVMVGCGGGWG